MRLDLSGLPDDRREGLVATLRERVGIVAVSSIFCCVERSSVPFGSFPKLDARRKTSGARWKPGGICLHGRKTLTISPLFSLVAFDELRARESLLHDCMCCSTRRAETSERRGGGPGGDVHAATAAGRPGGGPR